jgi:DNA-binding NarL/FixJ family response regulator
MITNTLYLNGLQQQQHARDATVSKLHTPQHLNPQFGPRVVTLRDFTPRQRDVLKLLCQGLPNKVISNRLNISAGTVKIHISHILRRFGVASRLQAVIAARSGGVVTD